jgi:hypothetical protein
MEEFKKLNAEVIGCSVDSHYTHLAWINTPRKEGGLGEIKYALLSDLNKNITEQVVWLLLFLLLVLLSTYLISSSVIALFVVTLPEMTPLKALAKAKKLVEFRRMSVMRKLVALLAVMLVLFVGIIFPSIFVSALLAQLLFFVLTVLFVPFAVGYMFVLYRELL